MVTCEKINYMHALLFNNSFKTIYIFSLFGFFGMQGEKVKAQNTKLRISLVIIGQGTLNLPS